MIQNTAEKSDMIENSPIEPWTFGERAFLAFAMLASLSIVLVAVKYIAVP